MAKITYPEKNTGDQFKSSEANEIKTSVNALYDEVEVISTEVDAISVQTLIASSNLFDKQAVTIDRAVSISNGSIGNYAGFKCAEHVAVTPNTKYTLWGFPVDNPNRGFRFEDISQNLISFSTISVNEYVFTTPANCYYISFTAFTPSDPSTLMDTLMLELGKKSTYEAYFSPYSSFGVQPLNNPLIFEQSTLKYNSPVTFKYFQDNASLSRIKGSKLLLFGDSITETITTGGSNRSNWPIFITSVLGVTYSNYARSGASFKDDASHTDPRQDLSRQINDAIAASLTPDIIVVSCGTNDGISLLGSYATAMGKTTLASLDKTNSLYEAIRWALWTIKTNWPNAAVYIATPLQRADVETETLEPLYQAIKKMANRYGFKIMDATYRSGIVKDFETWGSSGRYLSDGLHPNTTGQALQAKFYASEIIASYLP